MPKLVLIFFPIIMFQSCRIAKNRDRSSLSSDISEKRKLVCVNNTDTKERIDSLNIYGFRIPVAGALQTDQSMEINALSFEAVKADPKSLDIMENSRAAVAKVILLRNRESFQKIISGGVLFQAELEFVGATKTGKYGFFSMGHSLPQSNEIQKPEFIVEGVRHILDCKEEETPTVYPPIFKNLPIHAQGQKVILTENIYSFTKDPSTQKPVKGALFLKSGTEVKAIEGERCGVPSDRFTDRSVLDKTLQLSLEQRMNPLMLCYAKELEVRIATPSGGESKVLINSTLHMAESQFTAP